jgi:glycosyltransferase involved in cell wall biosynthesis
MRILQIIASMDPRMGGPGEVILQTIRALRAEGHSPEIACLDAPGESWVKDCPFPIHALGPKAGKYSYSPRFLPWLRGQAGRYDCLIVNGVWCFSSLGTWIASRRTGVPYFLYTHGMLDPWFQTAYPLKHIKKSIYWRLAEHRVLRDARSVLFTCEEEQILAARSFRPFRCRGAIVTNGIHHPVGDPAMQRRLFLEKFPEVSDKRVVVFVGRIHRKKGCDLLVEAFGAVAREHPDLHLVMVGPDETGWRADLERRASALGVDRRITWAGMLEGDLKWGAFHAADAFALPSHSENFGMVVAEAMACGLPVLISNKVNIWREILSDGAGFVAEDDLAGTTEALRSWLACTAEERGVMKDRALRCFNERFHIRRAASQLVHALRTNGVSG